MENKFGKVSRICATAVLKDNRTILEDISFTAPYKMMVEFRLCRFVHQQESWQEIHRNSCIM